MINDKLLIINGSGPFGVTFLKKLQQPAASDTLKNFYY